MAPKRDEKAWEKINRDLNQAASRQSLSQGGLPGEAVKRLQDILADKKSPFSSNFSVNEFLVSKAAGVTPIAQVSGTAMFHLGWQSMAFVSSGELEVLTNAQSSLRLLAVSRIQEEARILKADGIIGVKSTQQEYDWGKGLLQFTLIGTAVKLPGSAASPNPFVSTLTGQEFWSLYMAGFWPVGYAYGNSVYYQVATPATRAAMGEESMNEYAPMNTKWSNQELEDFTDALNETRSRAESRLQMDLFHLQAGGVLDLNFDRKIKFHERTGINHPKGTDISVSIELAGTAIVRRTQESVPAIDYRVMLT